jgi:hypothetical protein
MKLNSEIMSRMLTCTNLKGLIGEAPFVVSEDGIGTIQAIDYSGSFVVSCQGKVTNDPPTSPMTLGLCNIKMLCQFFCGIKDQKEQVVVVVKDEWMILKCKNGKIKTLLQSADTLPTKIDQPVTIEMFTEKSKIQFQVDQQLVDTLSNYISLVNPNSVIFAVKDGKLSIKSNEHDNQQFTFHTTIQVEPNDACVSSELFTNQLMPILEVALTTIANDSVLTVHMGDSTPFIIESTDGFWALMPIVA